jgi:hypothetical protein
MAARDYTGGEGLMLIRNLLQAGTTIAESVGEAVEILKQYAVEEL